MKQIIKITLILLIAVIAGCYYDTEERLYPKISSPCDDTVVTFSSTVTTILHSCQTCHSNSNATSSGGGIKLENYADVVKLVNNGKLMGSIRHDNGYIAMPQGGGKLSDCEISQLQKWIDNKTPNN
jgi:cytochrome c5